MNGLKPIRWPRNSLSGELRCFEFLFAENRFLAGVGSGAAVGRCQFVIFAFKFFFFKIAKDANLESFYFRLFPFTNAVPQATRLFRPLYLLSYLLNYHLRLTVLQDYFKTLLLVATSVGRFLQISSKPNRTIYSFCCYFQF